MSFILGASQKLFYQVMAMQGTISSKIIKFWIKKIIWIKAKQIFIFRYSFANDG